MEQTVYLDLYFMINFSMDLLCFILSSKLLSYPVSIKRYVVASVFGGMYACASLFLSPRGFFGLFVDIGACVAMSIIAVKKKGNLKECMSYALVYSATSIILGGFMTALYSLFNRIGLDRMLGSESDADGMSVWLFAILAVISGVVALFGGKIFRKNSSRRYGEVEITYGGKSTVLRALCDSGNLLREPISAKACIVVDKKEIEKILPRELINLINNGSLGVTDSVHNKKIRIIPTTTVGGEGMLYALRVDCLRVNLGKGWREVDAFVALGMIGDSEENTKALIPSDLAFGPT